MRTIGTIKDRHQRVLRAELEQVLRAIEGEAELPEAVRDMPHDLTDLVLLSWSPEGRKDRRFSEGELAKAIFGERRGSRNTYNATFKSARKLGKNPAYRQGFSVETLRSFLSAVFRLWEGEGSP